MRSAKILVVEDESITAKDIQETLKGYGYEVPAVVLSGEEAIEKAEQLQPDLVLMDIVLKGDVDGIEAAEQIFQRFGIPVVYLTAYADGKMVKRAKITEPFGYIIKPFEERQLHTNVEMALYKHKMEKALRESEEKLCNIVEHSTNLFYSHTPEHKLTYLSPQSREFLQCEPEEATVRWTEFATDNPINEEGFALTKKAIETGKRQPPYELELEGKKGRKIWVEVREAPIVKNGRTVGIVGSLTDITERKRAEERLEREQHLRAGLLDNIPNCMAMIIKKDTREIVASNKAAREIGAIPGRTCFKTCAERDAPCTFCLAPKLWAINKLQRLEVEYRGVWYEGVWVPLTEDLYVHYIYNITERKRAEKKIRDSETRFRELFEHISSGAAIYEVRDNGRDFVFKDFNKAGEQIDNVKKEELVGKSVAEVFPGVKEFGLFDVFKRVQKTGKPEHHPISQYKDERIVGWRENYVYKLPSGEIAVVYDDVTKQKQAEEQLFDYQRQLKSLASELTFAEEREKRRIATWLHDRLSQSLISCKLKLETAGDAASAEVARAMAETGKTLGDALEEVREMTFELGSPILYELGFETAVKDWLRENIQEKHGLETEFEDDGREKIMDDDVRVVLFRDVRELLVNVVKHARAKKVKVVIRKTNKHITVGVEDDGCGFDPEKIYESKTGKIGYGLFSIKERLEELGGHLDVKSRRGKGTLVTLSAPLKQ